jgi:hypothetical protein
VQNVHGGSDGNAPQIAKFVRPYRLLPAPCKLCCHQARARPAAPSHFLVTDSPISPCLAVDFESQLHLSIRAIRSSLSSRLPCRQHLVRSHECVVIPPAGGPTPRRGWQPPRQDRGELLALRTALLSLVVAISFVIPLLSSLPRSERLHATCQCGPADLTYASLVPVLVTCLSAPAWRVERSCRAGAQVRH